MRLIELREERNLTQNDIANAINTSRTNIGRWEKGLNEPASSYVVKLADFFEVTTDYLLGREDDFGNITVKSAPVAPLPNNEQALLDAFRKLPDDLKHRATAYMNKLVELGTEEKQTFTTKNTRSAPRAPGRKSM